MEGNVNMLRALGKQIPRSDANYRRAISIYGSGLYHYFSGTARWWTISRQSWRSQVISRPHDEGAMHSNSAEDNETNYWRLERQKMGPS